jgi:hypothetical protein
LKRSSAEQFPSSLLIKNSTPSAPRQSASGRLVFASIHPFVYTHFSGFEGTGDAATSLPHPADAVLTIRFYLY